MVGVEWTTHGTEKNPRSLALSLADLRCRWSLLCHFDDLMSLP